MGQVAARSFTGVGSTSGAKELAIRLSCSGSAVGNYTTVHVTLSDVTHPDNTSTTLSLSPESAATGSASRYGTTVS